MSSESENFEQVRQLLALKRHEVPPPGYFNGFSREVIARIKAGEGRESSWWERLHSYLEIKPAFAGAFGAAVCLILVAGVLNSEETGVSSPVFSSAVQGVAGFDPQETALARPSVSGQPVLVGTTNSAAVLREMFDHIQPQTHTVGFGFTPNQ